MHSECKQKLYQLTVVSLCGLFISTTKGKRIDPIESTQESNRRRTALNYQKNNKPGQDTQNSQ